LGSTGGRHLQHHAGPADAQVDELTEDGLAARQREHGGAAVSDSWVTSGK
jgi:hypothetical protein